MSLIVEELLAAFYQDIHRAIRGRMELEKKLKEMDRDIEKILLSMQNGKDTLEKLKKETNYGKDL